MIPHNNSFLDNPSFRWSIRPWLTDLSSRNPYKKVMRKPFRRITMHTLSVLIPTLNEEEAIGPVLDECLSVLKGLPLKSEIIIVDGDSHDKTREIAQEKGARIILEKRKGKGIGVKTAFQHITSTYTVMLDGDYTYDPGDIPKMLEPLQKGADYVLGHRQYQKGSMTALNSIGNNLITMLVYVLHGVRVSDVCTGYWAFKKDVVTFLKDIDAVGFDLEVSMLVRAFHAGFSVAEVPVTYRPRKGKAKLHPLKGGISIVGAVVRMLRDYHPLKLFGSISFLSFFLGVILGIDAVTAFQRYGEITVDTMAVAGLSFFAGALSLYSGLSLHRGGMK
jgi:glycosyltransferase involved in cell wall biosynthesis